jgi:hypothetical protein
MKVSHAAAAVDVAFDDPNLIADTGLVPVIALAQQIGLPELVTEHVAITGAANGAGANPVAKVMSMVAGMVAGADSIEDMDRLRHTGNVVFDQILPPRRWHVFARVDPRACATAQRGAATQPHDTVATADTDDSANALVGHRRRHSGWGIRPPEAGAQVRILPGAPHRRSRKNRLTGAGVLVGVQRKPAHPYLGRKHG